MNTRGNLYCVLAFLLLSLPISLQAQMGVLTVNPSTNAGQLAEELVGPGVAVSNANLVCGTSASGFFTAPATPLDLPSGIFLGSGQIDGAVGPNTSPSYSTVTGGSSDPDLDAIVAPLSTHDACVLEFDVNPTGDTLKFNYTFGSEEYDEFVCSNFNDVFAFFISGPDPAGGNYTKKNIALIPGTNLPVAINSVNSGSPGGSYPPGGCTSLGYSQFYWNNGGGTELQYDGFTTVLSAVLPVVPCETYHLELKIADAGDGIYDSGVFLESESLTSNTVEVGLESNSFSEPSLVEGCLAGTMTLERSTTQGTQDVFLSYGGTATYGVDYSNLPDTITFQNNVDYVTFPITAYKDGLPEGTEEIIVYIGNPCTGSILDSAVISIIDSISIDVMPDTTICVGDSVTLWADSAQVYNWHSDPSILSTNGNEAVVKPDSTTTYKVTGNIGLCQAHRNITVDLRPTPIVDVGPDTNLCLGSNIQFQPDTSNTQGNVTFLWEPASAMSQTNILNAYSLPSQDTKYFLTVTNDGICSATDSLFIDVFTPPSVFAGQDQVICRYDTFTINAQSSRPGTFEWSPSAGLDTSEGKVVNASPQNSTVYSLDFTDTVGCKASDQIVIGINDLPNVGINSSNIGDVCEGDTVDLTASGAATYEWTPNSLVEDPFASATYSVPSDTATYILMGEAANGCINYDTLTINVNPNPDPMITADRDSICRGDSVLLTGSGTGNYTWTSSSGMTAPGVSDLKVSPASTTTYTLTIDNQFGCSRITEQEIAVVPLPQVDAGNDTTICESSLMTLSGSGASTYNWSPDTDLSCSDCAEPELIGLDPTTFTLTGYNEFGCSATDSVFVDITPLPDLQVSPAQAEICQGESVQLQAGGGITYAWEPATGLNNVNIANPVASPSQTTIYTVSILDVSGCQALKTIEIEVNDLPQVDAGTPDSICQGTSGQLNASGGNSYIWAPATGLSDPTVSNPEVTISQSTTYTVTGTDANGCENTDEVSVEVLDLPVASAGPDQQVCENEKTQLTGSGGDSYQWAPSTGLSCSTCQQPKLFATNAMTYSLTVTDKNGCTNTDAVNIEVDPAPPLQVSDDQYICHYDSVRLNATAGYDYQWWPAAGLDDPTGADPMAKPDTSTMFYVEVTDNNNCTSTDSVAVNYYPETQVQTSPDTVICELQQATITAEGVSSYSWSPAASLNDSAAAEPVAAPMATTTYTVTGTDANGCISTGEIRVAVNPLPDISLSTVDTTICANTSLQLEASGGSDYSWSPAAGLDQSDIADPIATPTLTTDYRVEVATSEGCIDSATVAVRLFEPTDPDPGPGSAAICPGDSIMLTARNGVSYSWSPSASLSAANSDATLAYPDANTTYTIEIVDSNGCTFAEELQVDVHPDPFAYAGEDTRVFHGHSVALDADGNGSAYWQPSRWLSDPEELKPSATPDSTITYYLTITTQEGCTASDSVRLEVYYETKMYVANAFSPNGDGKNDRIGPVWFNEFELNEFIIYNRWGQIVFKTSDPDHHWDGTCNGEPQPVGTYVYILTGTGNRGEPFYKKGSITLIR